MSNRNPNGLGSHLPALQGLPEAPYGYRAFGSNPEAHAFINTVLNSGGGSVGTVSEINRWSGNPSAITPPSGQSATGTPRTTALARMTSSNPGQQVSICRQMLPEDNPPSSALCVVATVDTPIPGHPLSAPSAPRRSGSSSGSSSGVFSGFSSGSSSSSVCSSCGRRTPPSLSSSSPRVGGFSGYLASQSDLSSGSPYSCESCSRSFKYSHYGFSCSGCSQCCTCCVYRCSVCTAECRYHGRFDSSSFSSASRRIRRDFD